MKTKPFKGFLRERKNRKGPHLTKSHPPMLVVLYTYPTPQAVRNWGLTNYWALFIFSIKKEALKV